MKILTIRTDRPEAELCLYDGPKKLATLKWEAHLKLAETLNSQVEKILDKSSISYESLEGVVVYKGPGSFTGLRIGMSVANALAYSLDVPIVARAGVRWREQAIKDISAGQNDKIAVPEYGAPARVTQPRK